MKLTDVKITDIKKEYLLVALVVLLLISLPVMKAKKKTVESGRDDFQNKILPTPIKDEKYDVTEPITLNISEPLPGATVSNSSVRVKGKTLPMAVVFINEKEMRADRAGNFSTTVSLEEGENSIIILAHDADGNFSEKEITVNLETTE
jgi:hypothetical protein